MPQLPSSLPSVGVTDDEWGDTPVSQLSPNLPSATAADDEWGGDVTHTVSTRTAAVQPPAKADEDDWGTDSVSTPLLPPKTTMEDDWGTPSTPSTTSWNANGNRGGRGGFSGGRGGRGGGSGGPRICFRCNQEGHISRDCSQGQFVLHEVEIQSLFLRLHNELIDLSYGL